MVKKKRLILIICSCICVLLASAVVTIAFTYSPPKHKHVFAEDKTYHICNNGIYYTKTCKDGCIVSFETKATFTDVLSSVTEIDNIVLDENVILTEDVIVKSFAGSGDDVQDIELNINLDLNGFTLSTNVENSQNNSLFMFNANRGSVEFNVKNGRIENSASSYIFRFKNTKKSSENITLNLQDVECVTSGSQTTPLYGKDCYGMVVNAKNTKFISQNPQLRDGAYGVGVFIDCESEFNFTDCYFEGGDAVHIKSGEVNLTRCKLSNVGLVSNPAQNTDLFSAVGACLVAVNHTTSNGVSLFNITIVNCEMEANASFKTIYVIETASNAGMQLGVNQNSCIDVQSCKFNQNPTALTIPQYSLVIYPNGQAPQNNGTQTWICGDWSQDIE